MAQNGLLIEYDFGVTATSLFSLRTARIQNELIQQLSSFTPTGNGVLNATEFSFYARLSNGLLAAWLFVNPAANLLDGFVQVQGQATDRISLIRPTAGRPRWCSSGVPTTVAPATLATTTTTTTTTRATTPAPTTTSGAITIAQPTTTPPPITTTTTTTATATAATLSPQTTNNQLPTGLTLPTLLPIDLTPESGTPQSGGVILTQDSPSTGAGSDSARSGAGVESDASVSDGAVIIDSDLALPIGLGVAGGLLLLCACLVVALIVVKRRRRNRQTVKTEGNYDFSMPPLPKANAYGQMPASRGSPPNQAAGVVGIYASARPETEVTQYLGLSNVAAPTDVHSTYGNIALKSDYAPDSEISTSQFQSFTEH